MNFNQEIIDFFRDMEISISNAFSKEYLTQKICDAFQIEETQNLFKVTLQ